MTRAWPMLVLAVLLGWQANAAFGQKLQVKEKSSVELRGGFGVLSPDGKLYVGPPFGKELCVYDAATGKLITSRTGINRAQFPNGAFSPDGTLFAFIGEKGIVSLWDKKTWKQSTILRVPNPESLAFSPDSKELAVELSSEQGLAVPNSKISIWEVQGEKGVKERALLPASTYGPEPAYSPDGKLLFTGSEFYNAVTEEKWKFPSGRSLPEGVTHLRNGSFSPDSKFLAARFVIEGKQREVAGVWDMTTGKQVWAIEAPPIGTTVFSPDGKILVIPSAKGIELIAVGTWKSLATLNGWFPVVFSQGGKTLTAGGGGTIKVWELTWEKEPGK